MIATLPPLEHAPMTSYPSPDPSPAPLHRWLHVVSHTDPRYGGLSTAVPALAASIAATTPMGSSLAAFCRPGEEYPPAFPVGQEIPVSFWPTSRLAWALNRDIKASFRELMQPSNALHVHGLWEESTAVACATARQAGKPYVLSAHGMLEPWALRAKRLKKQIYSALVERRNVAGAACLHALTHAEAAQYRAFGAACPIAVIPNAVDLPTDAHADLFLNRFPALRGKRLVLFLSRLHPKKGLDLLVESWARVARLHPDAHLVIAGPDSDGMQARLTEDVQRHRLAAQVTFTGMLQGEMKWSALDAAECYVLPSRSEGLSMALLEAMGMGVPVIATRACNMPEITAADAGWETEPEMTALSGVLADLLAQPADRNRAKGHNGARLIASHYSPAEVARQMAEVYAWVLGGPLPEHATVLTGGAQ